MILELEHLMSVNTAQVIAMHLLKKKDLFAHCLPGLPGQSYLNRPVFLKWENISPPGIYSSTMYRLELSCKSSKIISIFNILIT